MPSANEQALADELSRLARIVILDQSRCQPNMPAYDYLRKNASLGCGRAPACIQFEEGRCVVLEDACPTCLNRAKRCPGGAVRVVNLPHSLAPAVTHRFGPNSFKLHRLPVPRANQVLGLVGTNGIGKSSSLQILAGRLKPNLGRLDQPAEWDDVLAHHRGSELQSYFTRMLDHGQTAVTKLQYVDLLPEALAPLGLNVGELLAARDQRGALDAVVAQLELTPVLARRVEQLSGGELQRLALALVLLQKADVYVFDEPSSYLDVAQRLRAARAIRALLSPDTSVVAVEHDLSLLDYLSDHVCLLYGVRGACMRHRAPPRRATAPVLRNEHNVHCISFGSTSLVQRVMRKRRVVDVSKTRGMPYIYADHIHIGLTPTGVRSLFRSWLEPYLPCVRK